MSIRIRRRWVLAISCLIISGCTEKTIIREVSPSSQPEASVTDGVASGGSNSLTPTIGAGSNMVTGGTNTVTRDETDTGTGMGAGTDSETGTDTGAGQLEDLQTSGETDDNVTGTPRLQDPIVATVDGEPGLNVDCDNTLPCRWISDDSQFSATVTSADNVGSRDRLQLSYTLETSHDTQVSIAEAGLALDDTDTELQPDEVTLGSDVSAGAQDLLAGSTMDGKVVFDQGTASITLSEWSATILDGGVARLPSFMNIPVGTITTAYADCELILPCVWVTPQGDVSITLTSAGGYSTNTRLATTFMVQSATTIDVALDAGALAIGSEGTEFTGRTHSLGATSGVAKLTAEAFAGSELTGVVDYYRTLAEPTVLDEVSLVIYQDSPVPRWNPKFVNVPAQ